MELLVFAHKGEAQFFIQQLQLKPVSYFFDGLFKNDETYLLITGEGLQNAMLKTSAVLASFEKEIHNVANIGIAGSLTDKTQIDSLFWIRTIYCEQFDRFEYKSFSCALNNENENFMDCISSNQRIMNLETKKHISNVADIVDREAWGIAQSTHLFKKPLRVLKMISDDATHSEFCTLVKERAPHFSSQLYNEYFKTHFELKKTTDNLLVQTLLDLDSLHFTLTQKRQLVTLCHKLKLKGLLPQEILEAIEIDTITQSHLKQKDRSRLVLTKLNHLLSPISKAVKEKIDHILSPLTQVDLDIAIDPHYESQLIDIHLVINSEKDLNRFKKALDIFSYSQYEDIFNGKLE